MSPSCRDKGWMRGWAGALCLSCWPDDSSGVWEAPELHPEEDRHKAPASAPLLPCHYRERPVSAVTGVGRHHSLSRGYAPMKMCRGERSCEDAPAIDPYKRPPVIRIPICSSVASGDTISTILPSYMTAMRSDSERISSNSADTSSTALPASRTSIRRR